MHACMHAYIHTYIHACMNNIPVFHTKPKGHHFLSCSKVHVAPKIKIFVLRIINLITTLQAEGM